MDRFSRASLWCICISPLVWIPGGLDRFVFAKLVVAAAAVALAAAAPRSGRLEQRVRVVAAVGVACFAIACLISPTPIASLVGRWPRYEGLPVILTYAGCAWAGARLLGGRKRAAVEEFLRAISVASLLLAAAAVLSELGWHVEGASVESRAGSVLGNATDQGVVAMVLFAVLFPVAIERRTPLLIAGATAAPLVVVLSGSRAALLTLIVVAIGQALLRRRDLIRYAAGGTFVVVAAALALPQVRDRLGESDTITGRWVLWKDTMAVARDRWFAGGPSTFVDTVGMHHSQEWVRKVGPSNPPDSPHSWPLQALVAGGVPLLILALLLAGVILTRGWQQARSEPDAFTLGLLGAVVGYGVALLPNFTIAGSTCLAAFVVGAIVGEAAQRKEDPWAPRAVVAAGCIGILVFAGGAFGERSLQHGIEAARAGDLDAAESAFDQARALRPLDGDVAMFAAQSFAGAANAGQPDAADKAVSWAQRSLDRTPDTYQSGLALAVGQIAQEDLGSARSTLDRLVRLYPTEPSARVQRALARFGLEDFPGAQADLEIAIRLDPKDPTAQRVLDEMRARMAS